VHEVAMKCCSEGKPPKSLSEFGPDKRRTDGHTHRCRKSDSARVSKYNNKNRRHAPNKGKSSRTRYLQNEMHVQCSRLQDELARFNGNRVASTAIQIPRLITLIIRSQ
jgi:hypothetical protein